MRVVRASCLADKCTYIHRFCSGSCAAEASSPGGVHTPEVCTGLRLLRGSVGLPEEVRHLKWSDAAAAVVERQLTLVPAQAQSLGRFVLQAYSL